MDMVLVLDRINSTDSLEAPGQSELRGLPTEIRELLSQRLYLPQRYLVLDIGYIKLDSQ